MSQVIITTTDEYVIVKIPKNSLEGKRLSGKKVLTEAAALRIFNQAKKDYQVGKLNTIQDLSQLL